MRVFSRTSCRRRRPPARVRPATALALLASASAAALSIAGVSRTAVAASAPGRIVKGPYLTGLSDTGADVRFELDADGPAAVDVVKDGAPPGPGQAPPRTFDDHGARALHDVHVSGLEPAVHYSYVVRAGSAVLGRGHLTTAPDPASSAPAPLHFIVYGDNRSDPSAHAAIVRQLQDDPADFLVNTGDIVADGGNAQDWQTFFDVEAPILRDRPLFLAIGNHELYDDAAGANFARYFGFADASGAPEPYGTVRIGEARFFFLNGMDDFGSGPERAWLERALASADGEKGLVWRIAVVHHGPWSSGPHGGNERLADAHVPELLAQHEVDLVLSGHDHLYERGDAGSMKYVLSGGGGAPLYRVAQPIAFSRKTEPTYHFVDVTVTGDALRLLAKRIDGTVLDRCGFTKGGPWDCDPPAPPAAPAGHVAANAANAASTANASAESGTPGASAKSSCGCSVPGARVAPLAEAGVGALGLLAALGAFRRASRRRRG